MFKFKDILSTDFGVKILSKKPMAKSARRYEKNIYYGNYVAEKVTYKDEFLMTETDIVIECDKSKVRELYAWLDGHGDYVDMDEPDKYYKVYACDFIESNRVNVSGIRQLMAKFKAQPFAYNVSNPVITSTNNSIIENTGNVISQPVYKLAGSGTITLKVNGTTTPLTILDVNGTIVVDTINMLIYDLDTKVNFMNKSTGKLPLFDIGNNLIQLTNITNCEILVNVRWY